MNFYGWYTQAYVNRKSKRALKQGRVLLYLHYYRASWMRWRSSVGQLPGIRGEDEMPTCTMSVVHYKEKEMP